MHPNYIVKKSIIPVLNLWLILFFWLVIPLIIQVLRIVTVKQFTVEFYDHKVVTRAGLFRKWETQVVFMGVNSVSVSQSLLGQIFGYGDVRVDCRGKWDVDTYGIKNPKGLKTYLEKRITADGITTVITG